MAKDVVRYLMGVAIVYIACAAESGQSMQRNRGSGGSAGTMGEIDSGAAPKDSGTRGVLDALTNPVPEAEAAVAPATVVTEQCPTVGAPGVPLFATHSFPGKVIQDLAALQVVGHLAPTNSMQVPSGFENGLHPLTYVKDGAATAYCGSNGALIYDSITFILP